MRGDGDASARKRKTWGGEAGIVGAYVDAWKMQYLPSDDPDAAIVTAKSAPARLGQRYAGTGASVLVLHLLVAAVRVARRVGK